VNDALERLAREYAAGTVLFEEGQPGDDMYIVVSGEVELRRQVGDAERVLAVLPAGEFFGEMAILNGRPRSATAVVKTAARLFVIDGTTFEAMLRARPEIALRMIKALATRLDGANHHVELLLLPTANHRVVQCLRHMAEEQLALVGEVGRSRRKPRPMRETIVPVPATPADALAETTLTLQGTEVLVPKRVSDIAARVGLSVDEVNEVLDRLRAARLILSPSDAGLPGDGFIVPEVGRLQEFLEFLTLKDRFGA
jgi:CRP/FNR family cyclic AMP-dependent transcriptional regulator